MQYFFGTPSSAPVAFPIGEGRSADSAVGETPERAGGRRWLALAVGSMMLSGALALGLVLARLPGVSRFVTDPVALCRNG